MAFKLIRVDDEIFERLRDLAQPGETPNTVLRRALSLAPMEQGRRSGVLKPFTDETAEAAA